MHAVLYTSDLEGEAASSGNVSAHVGADSGDNLSMYMRMWISEGQ